MKPFEGGYTRSFKEGVFHHVLHFDVASLYPSLLLGIGHAQHQDRPVDEEDQTAAGSEQAGPGSRSKGPQRPRWKSLYDCEQSQSLPMQLSGVCITRIRSFRAIKGL